MSIRDSLRQLAYNVRAIPNAYGLRPYHSVAILAGAWSGTVTGRGLFTAELTPITEANGAPPKVREVSTEELALGNLGKGSLKIGPITPDFPGGGTAIDVLKPAVDAGQTVQVLITGAGNPDGSLYVIKSINADHGLHWTMTVTPVQNAT